MVVLIHMIMHTIMLIRMNLAQRRDTLIHTTHQLQSSRSRRNKVMLLAIHTRIHTMNLRRRSKAEQLVILIPIHTIQNQRHNRRNRDDQADIHMHIRIVLILIPITLVMMLMLVMIIPLV